MTAPAAGPSLKIAIVPVTVYQQNCTLIWDPATAKGAVIDPGGEVPRILEAIAEVKMTPEKILITHGHTDHAAGAAELAEALNVKVEGPHQADEFLLKSLAKRGRDDGFGGRDLTPDRWLKDGDTVTFAGHTWDIFHVPGHSPGSVVFVARDRRIAIVGDVLFRGSIGRTDLGGYGDHAALIGGIKSKLLPLGDDIPFLCGHGPGSTFGHERKTNPYLQG